MHPELPSHLPQGTTACHMDKGGAARGLTVSPGSDYSLGSPSDQQ